jgi:hypothetical protein
MALIANWLSSGEGPYTITAAVAGVAALAILVWLEFIKPRLRERRLKSPCDLRFVVRRHQHANLPYLLQDDDDHAVHELVLPSNSSVEIEVGFIPKVPFFLEQIILGCEGDPDQKPYITEAMDRFTEGQKRWRPGEGGHSRDIHKHWHTLRNSACPVGTHRVSSYQIQTRGAGVYRFQVAFVTNEIEGNGDLSIRVEDKPLTRMQCRSHSRCYIRPIVTPAPSSSAERPS